MVGVGRLLDDILKYTSDLPPEDASVATALKDRFRALLRRIALLNFRDNHDRTLLHHACSLQAGFMKQFRIQTTALVEIMMELFSDELDAQDVDNNTALIVAASSYASLCYYWQTLGFDADEIRVEQRRMAETLRLLLDHGAHSDA